LILSLSFPTRTLARLLERLTLESKWMLVDVQVVANPAEMARFARALETAADAVLDFGSAKVGTPVLGSVVPAAAGAAAGGARGAGAAAEGYPEVLVVPGLKFDRLLSVLLALGPAFAFQLPPYFLNNARALGALEGLAAQVKLQP
jgi:hypothetical protein